MTYITQMDQSILLVSDLPGWCRIAHVHSGDLKTFRLLSHTTLNDHLGSLHLARVQETSPAQSGYFLDMGQGKRGFLPKSQARYCPHTNLAVGQTCLVQLDKLAISSEGKLPRLTTRLRFPAYHLVYCPTESGIQFSGKITDAPAKKKIKSLLEDFCQNHDIEGGFICRHHSIHQTEKTLLDQAHTLYKLWLKDQQHLKKNSIGPISDHRNHLLSIVEQISDIDQIIIEQNGLIDWRTTLTHLLPILPVTSHYPAAQRLKVWTSPQPLLSAFHLSPLPSELYETKFFLENGAWISFEQTAALTAIDVNSGTALSRDSEQTHLDSNLSALSKLQDLLRIRGFQGQIALDLIPLKHKKNRQRCLDILTSLCHNLTPSPRYYSVPGTFLIIISGQGNQQYFQINTLSDPCPTCHHIGHAKGIPTFKPAFGLFYLLQYYQAVLIQRPDWQSLRGQFFSIDLPSEYEASLQSEYGRIWIQLWQQATGLNFRPMLYNAAPGQLFNIHDLKTYVRPDDVA